MSTTAKSWSSVVGSNNPPQHMTTTLPVSSEKALPEWGIPSVASAKKATTWTPGGAIALAKKKIDEKKTDITSMSEFPTLSHKKTTIKPKEKEKETVWSLSHSSKLAQIGTRCHDDGPITDTFDEDDY